MFNWIRENYYWLWHDYLQLPHPFTWYLRQLAHEHWVKFWLPVFVVLVAVIAVIIGLIVLLISLFRLKYHVSPFWRIVGEIATIIALIVAIPFLLFVIWFILHIAKVHPFGAMLYG